MINVDNLLKKNWYLQGFNATPAMLYGPAFSMVRDMPKALGFGYCACIEYFKDDVCYYAYAWDDLCAILEILLKKCAGNKNYPGYLVRENEKICHEVLSAYDRIERKNWQTASVKQLFSFWRQINDLSAYLCSVSHIVEGFSLTTEDKIRKLIAEEFKDDILDKIILLTTPRLHSFMTIEHYELCLLARLIKNKKITLSSVTDLKKYPDILKKLIKHQQKYFWKLNGYTSAKKLLPEDFVDEIRELLSKKVDLDKIIFDYQSLSIRVKKRDALRKKIKNKELKNLLTIGDKIFQIHDRRKECLTRTIHYLDSLLLEISRRFNVSMNDLRYIRASELEKLPGIMPELKKRRKTSLFVLLPGLKGLVFSGAQAKKYFKILEMNQRQDGGIITELKGACASSGKVIGIVKVCRGEKEISKMRQGDILVACMTQPEFLPAMKKAKAIITDEGGLTCHAAIIARELGIPCIIGTKNATKILKDGEEVEVNAIAGVVRIIKKIDMTKTLYLWDLGETLFWERWNE